MMSVSNFQIQTELKTLHTCVEFSRCCQLNTGSVETAQKCFLFIVTPWSCFLQNCFITCPNNNRNAKNNKNSEKYEIMKSLFAIDIRS